MRPSLPRFLSHPAALVVPVAAATGLVLVVSTSAADAKAKKPADKTAPVISSMAISPSPLILAVKSGGKTSFKVTVRANDDTGVDRITIGLYDPSDKNGRAYRLSRSSGTAASGVWTGSLSLPNNAKTGMYAVRAFATDLSSNSTNPDLVYTNFRVVNKTRLSSFKITVDSKTGAMTASALLERFRSGKWEPFTAREIALEFAAAGTQAYKPVTTGTTNDKGVVSFDKVTASKSGSWRVVFAGHPNYGPSEKAKDVTVNLPAASPTPSPAASPAATPAATPKA
ncbi:hypothetical protein GCM10009547_11670 [Sporichthya brevicatena]|uniref:Uncharacterized protein n=1 Tax=Sporichthya brevicatena TaxID=171442 RepID=A0ABN1GGZ8_9ACTN